MTATEPAEVELSALARLPLDVDEVQVWQVPLGSLSRLESQAQDLLSPDEQQRAARFVFQKDRECYAAVRALLRTLLAAHMECAPRDLLFCYSQHDKPALAGKYVGNGLQFNVSHSGQMAAIAITRGRSVGIDIEKLRDDFAVEEIAQRFFSQAENDMLMNVPPELKVRAFFNCWTRKEAFVKAKGEGLSLPLNQFDVSLIPGQTAEILGTRPDAGEKDRWSLWALDAGDQYAAAIVVEGSGSRLVKVWPSSGGQGDSAAHA